MIRTDSRTLTLVHMGRISVAQAERAGDWEVDGPPRLVRALTGWGGFQSRFAAVVPAR